MVDSKSGYECFGSRLLKSVLACLVAALLFSVGLVNKTQAAEVVGIQAVNNTQGAWNAYWEAPAAFPLGGGYTDTQTALVDLNYEANGMAQHRSAITKSHTALGFDSRFTGSAITQSAWNVLGYHWAKYMFDINLSIDADENEYWELNIDAIRSGAGSNSYGGGGNAVVLGAANPSLAINHVTAVLDSGDLTLGVDAVPSAVADIPVYDVATGILSGTGPATVTVSYSMTVGVGAINLIPNTVYRTEAAFRMGLASSIAVLGRYPGTLANAWYTQVGAQGVRTIDDDGLFVSGALVDTDADGIAPDVDNCPNTYNDDQLDTDGNGVGDACAGPSVGDGAEILGISVANQTLGLWGTEGVGVIRYRTEHSDSNILNQLTWHPWGTNQWRSGADAPSYTPGPLGGFSTRFTAMAATESGGDTLGYISPLFIYNVDVMIGAAEGEYWEMDITARRMGAANVSLPEIGYVTVNAATISMLKNYGAASLKSGDIALPGFGKQVGVDFSVDQTANGVLSGVGPASVTLSYAMYMPVKTFGWFDILVANDSAWRMGLEATTAGLDYGLYPGIGSRTMADDGLFVDGQLLDVDPDADGVSSNVDNCPITYNDGQEDGDGDAVGDACDNCVDDYNEADIDFDEDGFLDQPDVDGDGLGDACDVCNGPLGNPGTWVVTYDIGNQVLNSDWRSTVPPAGNSDTGSLLNIRNTPFDLGNRDPGPIGYTTDTVDAWGFDNGAGVIDALAVNGAGWSPLPAGQPSTMTLVFQDDRTGTGIDMNASSVQMTYYRMSMYFASGAEGAAYVYSHQDYTGADGPDGPALGTLDSGSVAWSTNLPDYHTNGWLHCVGGFCDWGGFVEHYTYYKDFDMEYPGGEFGMRLNDFTFIGDLRYGTTPSVFVMTESENPNPPAPTEPATDSRTFLYLKGYELSRVYIPPSAIDDVDADGVVCDDDNCYNVPNAGQEDINGDGFGDACQPNNSDTDGWPDEEDNCPLDFNPPQVNSDTGEHGDVCDNCDLIDNPDQLDANGDGQGDICQKRDRDNDGWTNSEDNCGYDYNNDQADKDCDDIGDACDLCDDPGDGCLPEEYEPWVDADDDGVCDIYDICPADNPDDTDGDGVCESDDICPGGDDTVDTDLDGVADFCDLCPADNPDDTDGDGVCDSSDLCPLDNPDDTDGDGVCESNDICPGGDDTVDTDLDGVPDFCDSCPADNPDDTDGDGVCDSSDLCPLDNPDDTDGDGVCDSSDLCPLDNPDDTDGDGVCDSSDPCPLDNPDDDDSNGLLDCVQACAVGDDADGDDVCDGVDACPGVDDNLDEVGGGALEDEANGVPDCLELACLVGDETLNQGTFNTPVPWANNSSISSISPLGQEFVPQQRTLRAIKFWMHDTGKAGVNDPIHITLHEGSSITGPVIATSVGVAPFDGVFTSGMVRFDFPADVDVVPGDLYVFRVVVPNNRAGPAHWDAADPYPAGRGVINYGGYFPAPHDFGFETISGREGLSRGGDTDQDGVCDDLDQCAGEDDTIDLEPNGTPDCAQGPCFDFGGDADADGFCDGGEDLCIDIYNVDNTDTNGDGIGDECQCGDITGDGAANNDDVTEILLTLWGYGASTQPGNNWALCDVTGDGNCNNDDVTEILLPLWGYGAYNSPTVRWSCGEDSNPPPGLP